MSTNTYHFSASVAGVIGPKRSPWISTRGLLSRYDVACRNGCLVCLPRRHDGQVSLSIVILGIPISSSFFIIILIISVLIWPRRARHIDDCVDSSSCRHRILSACSMTLYNLFLDLVLSTISRPYRSNSINASSFIRTSQPASVAWPKLTILLLNAGIWYTFLNTFFDPLGKRKHWPLSFYIDLRVISKAHFTRDVFIELIEECAVATHVIACPIIRYHKLCVSWSESNIVGFTFFSLR